MNNVGVIDTFLNTFTTYIDSGFGLIKGEVGYLSSTLIVIDITLAGLFWAWGVDEDILQRLVKKTLYIGFFAFIINNFNNLSAIVFNSFAGLGLKAGGSSISTADFLRPGKLAQVGLDAGQPLLDAANQMMGFTSFFANFVQIAVLMVSWVLVLIAFFILAVQLFVTLIEFKLTTLAGFILIPFALFNKTAFLAEKVLGNIVASGVKVMVLPSSSASAPASSRSSRRPTPVASRRSNRRCLLCWPRSPCWGSASSARVSRRAWSPARLSSVRARLSEQVSLSRARRWPAPVRSAWPGGERWRPPPARPPLHAAARRWPVAHPPPTAWLRPDDPAQRAPRRGLAGWDARRQRRHQARCGARPPRPLAPCAKASPPAPGPASPPRAGRRPQERSAAIRRADPRRPGAGQPTPARRPGPSA